MNPLYRLLLNHPLLRMALAWAAGILLGWYMRYSAAPCGAVLFIVAGVLVALTLVLAFYKKHGNEYVFGGLLYAVVFLLGSTWLLFHFHRMQKQWPSTAQAYQAVVVGDVSRQGKTTVCPVRIVGCVDGDAVKGQDGVVQLRFLCDSTQQNLHVGDGVRFYGVVEKLRNPGNPDELDYATWLGRQGVSGGIFAGTHVKKVKEADANILRRHLSFLERLRLKALTYRVCLVRKFDRLQLHSQQEAVLQAMALGDKGQLSSQTRRIFSEVGASHVLALSGLHLGVLTFLILWLFRPLGRWRWGRMASVVVLLAFIWGFALLTGLHVSLCRAALMYSVGLIHYAMRAKGNAMDSLAFAAIVLLVWQPMNLMDVGFQLSFMSVFSILLFYPSFVKRCPRSRMWAWLAGLVFIAVASQVGAAPLTAHYFHLFSLGFLITNVVVIPCTYLLLGSALLYFLFEWLPVVQGLVGKILAWVSHFMYDAVELMARCWDWMSVKVNPSWLTVLLCYALMFSIVSAWKEHSRRWLVVSYAVLVLFAISGLVVDKQVNRQVIFYNYPSCPSVQFVEKDGRSLLWSAEKRICPPVQRFLDAHGLKAPSMLGKLDSVGGVVEFASRKIVVYDADMWKKTRVSKPLVVDILYLNRYGIGKEWNWEKYFIPRLVVVDASVSNSWRRRVLDALEARGWPYYDMATEGALVLKEQRP